MNILIVQNLKRDGDLPEIEVNIYNEKKKENVYSTNMQFNGMKFTCFRKYNGVETCSNIGNSHYIDFVNLVKKGVDKPTIVSIMQGEISYCILDLVERAKLDKDDNKDSVHVETINIFPHALEAREIDKFIEDCYFMIS